jgi:FdhD protein
MAPDQGSKPIQFSVLKPDRGATETIERSIIVEAPVAIEYNGIGYAVMMATPLILRIMLLALACPRG